MLVRARSTRALGTVRADETRQLRLRLAIPDTVGTGSCLLVAHRLDVGSVAAYKLAMRFLCAARASAIGSTTARRRLKPSIVRTWTPRCPTRSWRAVESRPLRPGTVRVGSIGMRTVRGRTLCVRPVRLRAVGT